MLIEIKGIGFPNKGAELMLAATIQKLRSSLDDVDFAMGATKHYRSRASYGLYQIMSSRKFGIEWAQLANLSPRPVGRRFGLITEKDIDVILDASGFAYGDQWGAQKAKDRLADDIVGWREQEKKVILLPQAFGPFSTPDIQEAMKTIVENANHVFARDKTSFEFMNALTPKATSTVSLAPDFTNLIKPIFDEETFTRDWGVCVVANNKMIEMSDKNAANAYVPAMTAIVDYLSEHNLKPFLLVHEGIKDEKLAVQISEQAQQDIPIIKEADPLKVKGIIGKSKAIVSSRFHGLVSGLSQAVPSFGTGWSHKYQMLFEDYGCPECLLDVAEPQDAILEKISALSDPAKLESMHEALAVKAKEQKALSEDMWTKVVDIIKS